MVKPKTTPTPPETVTAIDAMHVALMPILINLYERWSDEHEYEDIAEYRPPIEKALPAGVSISTMTKRPFGFTFKVEGFEATYAMYATARMVAWKRVA